MVRNIKEKLIWEKVTKTRIFLTNLYLHACKEDVTVQSVRSIFTICFSFLEIIRSEKVRSVCSKQTILLSSLCIFLSLLLFLFFFIFLLYLVSLQSKEAKHLLVGSYTPQHCSCFPL